MVKKTAMIDTWLGGTCKLQYFFRIKNTLRKFFAFFLNWQFHGCMLFCFYICLQKSAAHILFSPSLLLAFTHDYFINDPGQ